MISNNTSYKVKASKSTRDFDDSDNNYSDENYDNNINDEVNGQIKYNAYSRENNRPKRSARRLPPSEFRPSRINRSKGASGGGRRNDRNGTENVYVLNRKYQENSRLADLGTYHGKFYEPDKKTTSDISTSSNKLSLPEDTRISKLLRRLSTETDQDSSLAISKKLLEVLLLPDNASYVRKAFHILGESMYDILQVSPGAVAKQQAARALGRMGYIMGQENDFERYQSWLFVKIGSADEEIQILLIKSIKETLAFEKTKPVLQDYAEILINNIVGCMEVTDNIEVFKVTLDVLMTTAEIYSNNFYTHFQDTVDILFGWHVDHTQPLTNIEFISKNLQRIGAHFQYNLDFAVSLIENFMEDMNNYADQLHNDSSLEHVTVLILALNTVLRCLGDSFHPKNNKYVTVEFVTNCLTQIIKTATDALDHFVPDNLIIAANESVAMLTAHVDSKTQHLNSLIYGLIDLELSLLSNFTDATVVSVLLLVAKSIKELSANLPFDLIEKLIGPKSELIRLRVSYYQNIQESVSCVYQALLNLKNVSLLQEAYRYVLGDLECLYVQLVPDIQRFIQNNPFADSDVIADLDDDCKEQSVLFLIRCLSQLANASSIIVMWALNPSILELVGVNLEPHHEMLSRNSPAVQYSLLYMLYSHCKCYNNFISSSNLVAKQHDSSVNVMVRFALSEGLSKNDVPNTSPNLGNFEIILEILCKTLSSHTTSEVTLLLLRWLNDILRSSESYLKHLHGNDKFMAITKVLIQCGYQFQSEILLGVCENLNLLLTNKDLTWSDDFLTGVCDLCKLHLNSINVDVRRSYMKLLTTVPWDVTVTEFKSLSAKNNHISNSKMWLAHHLHSAHNCTSTGGISPLQFEMFMNHLLKNEKNPPHWIDDIFYTNWPTDSSYKVTDFHYDMAVNSHAVLFRWLTLECVDFCVNSKLRTPLGKPNETFTKIEAVLNYFGNDLNNRKHKDSVAVAQPVSKGNRVKLLLQFVEHLEKSIYNAAEGCAMAMPPPSKQVRSFFIANSNTCSEWYKRIRMVVIHISLHAGDSCSALRHGQALLDDLYAAGKTEDPEFEKVVMLVCLALLNLGEPEALYGLYSWCKNADRKKFYWLKYAAEHASRRYETALEGYKAILRQLEGSESADPKKKTFVLSDDVQHFIYDQVVICYKKIQNWVDLVDWKNEYSLASSVDNDRKFWFNINDWPCINALFQIEMDIPSFDELSKWEYKSHSQSWSKYENLSNIESNLYRLALNVGANKEEALAQTETNLSEIQQSIRYHIEEVPSYFMEKLLVMQSVACGLKSVLTSSSLNTIMSVSQNFESKLDQIDSSILKNVLWWFEYFATVPGYCTPPFVTDIQLKVIKRARHEKNFKLAFVQLKKFLKGDALQIVDNNAAINPLYFLEKVQEVPNWTEDLARAAVEIIKLSYGSDENRQNTFNLCAAASTAISKHADLYGNQELKKISSRILLKLADWLQMNEETCTTELDSQLGKLLSVLPEIAVLERTVSDIIPMNEMAVGKLLQFSINQCASLAKNWNAFGAWCYRWGRKIVDHSSKIRNKFTEEDRMLIKQILPLDAADQDLNEIFTIMSQSYAHNPEEEDIEVNQGCTTETILSQLKCTRILSDVAAEDHLQMLVQIWKNAQQRIYGYYALSAEAYFKYLHLASHSTDNVNATSTQENEVECNVITVTLRLLRLIVKYALELQGVLENGLHNTPTQPWKMVIPQLFSRLNHPESYVRHRVSDLLCRIAEDAPHLITFPAVVGALEGGLKFNFSEISMPKDCLSQDNNACQAEDELNEDEYNYESDDEDMTLDGLQSCFKTMVDTLRKRDFETISQVQSLVRELRRITLLWDELWLGTLTQHQNEISKRQQQLEYEIDRVHQNPNLTGEEKISLIAEKHRIIIKPIVFILEQLHQVTSVEAETPHEKQFQLRYSAAIKEVIRKLKNPECPDKPQESLHPLKHLLKQFQARFSRRVSYSLKMQSISPVLASIRDTLIAMPGLTTSSKTTVRITAVSNVVSILPTKTKPKKLIFYGSDGKEYTYLFKGLEDLHLDERIMQFLSIANTMMATGADLTCPNLYRARHYSVIPLGPRSGLISWVNGTTPLFALYKRWQQRELVKASLKNNTDKMMGASTANNSVPRPSELFYNKLNPLLKEHGQVKNIENRKEWPLSVLKQVLSELMAETPSDLLAKELWCNSTSACSWWKVVKTYSYSVAVMSIIGYIIGLGDRHLDNVLVDLKTGEVVHIDYNVCFEKGRSLRVPEKVPFRLTPNIRRALGVTEVEGIFRVACENVLKTLKKGRETLLTLLEAFVYDPLIDWTSGGEVLAGTTFGGGGGTPSMNSKQNKKNLEKEITISMFAVRCTEIGVAWDENKTLILAEIPPLMEKFNRWLTINEKIGQTEDHLHDLHQQMALIKEAEAHGINKHPLYGLPSRYQIHCKSQATLNDARQGLEKIITESQNHMTMYTESLRLLESPQLMQWLQESSKSNGADMNVFDLVKEFLHNAGKDDVITQCEQSENDIEQLFQCQNLSIRRCLQLLQEYNSILMQCPRSYIENHRIYLFLKWAQYMLDTKTVDGVDVIYEKFKTFVDSHSSTPKNMLQFSYCLETLYKETMVQVNKLYEDLTQIRAQDSSEDLETLYANTRMNVSSFLNSEKGATSAYEFVIANELLLLNKNFLTLETAASRSGDLLIKLTSKDGDWFLDDLVLNSTRAVEMINNLPVNENNRDDERFLNLLNGIKIANNVYKGLHELHFNFHTIILPESMRKIQSEELSVIQMIADLNCLVAEVPDMIVQLEKMLPCLYMQMELNPSHEIVLERVLAVRKQFQILVETSSETLTAGKMLLMGFNGLFEKLHQEMDYLVVVLTGIDIPSSWKRLDLVTDSKIIAAHIFDARVHAVLQDVLFLKRLQTMHDFFRLVVEMCQSFANNEEECVVYTDDQLVKPVRQFIADFISKQLLGITTEAIAYAICFLLQHLKFNVTHEIEQKDIGAETKVPLDELCQKAWNHLVKQGVFTQNVLSQASGFSAGLKRTWEKIQEPKKIELKLTLQQSSALRMQNQLTVYNFMYEETFEQMHAFNTVGGKFVLDLKSEIANLKRLSSKLAETLNRQRGLIESAHQRLNWAKGANPEVGEISQAFDNGVAARDLKLELESSVVKDVLAACNTILLHELLRTHTNESKKYDKLFLNSFEKWRLACQCATSDVEILTPTEENIMRVLKPSQIDSKNPSKWLQHVSETISNLIKTTQANLEGQKTKLFCLFDVLSTSLDKLKDLHDVHCKLMSDVKGLIKSMTKIDEYSAQAIQFTEDYKQFTENFALIFSKFKREIDIDDIGAIVGALKYLQDNAETVYEKMLNLEKRETISRPPLTRQDCLFGGDDNDNNCDGTMSVQGSTQLRKQESLNNKGQQRNAYAVSVWRRVKMKLEGRDPDPGRKHTTEEQVDYVIQEATNMDNLALLYEGWTPWV